MGCACPCVKKSQKQVVETPGSCCSIFKGLKVSIALEGKFGSQRICHNSSLGVARAFRGDQRIHLSYHMDSGSSEASPRKIKSEVIRVTEKEYEL